MKNTTKLLLAIASVSLLTFGVIGIAQLNAGNKVTLHHGSKIIKVSVNSVSAHLNHGDVLHLGEGQCTLIGCDAEIIR